MGLEAGFLFLTSRPKTQTLWKKYQYYTLFNYSMQGRFTPNFTYINNSWQVWNPMIYSLGLFSNPDSGWDSPETNPEG